MSDEHRPAVSIRPEEPGDIGAIYDLTRRAFAPMPFAAGDEQDLINALREACALSRSLVVIRDEQVIGHIAFSPAYAADGLPGWFALGPVSVEPDLQGQGIGSALIRAGLEWLGEIQAAGCILTGNPDFYRRFGFELFPELAPPSDPAEYFMILPLACRSPEAIISFHPLFHA